MSDGMAELGSSPYINHFIQPDTIIPNPADPQSWNRYSYGLNNHVRYADPTGHSPIDGPCGYQGQDCSSPLPTPSGGGNGGGNGAGSGGIGGGNSNEQDDPIDQLITVASDSPGCWDYAAFCNGYSGNYSPDFPGWHYYPNLNLVCPAYLHCTAAQMRDYLSRFAFPGQDPTQPVSHNSRSFVTVFGFIPLGTITTDVSVDGLKIVNKTTRLHFMHNGQVERSVHQTPDGTWYVATTGSGNNVSIPNLGWSFAPVNQSLGPVQFDNFDIEMLNYILENQ
jgi:hypothetical protein